MSVSLQFERNPVCTSSYTSEDAIDDERIASIEYRMRTPWKLPVDVVSKSFPAV